MRTTRRSLVATLILTSALLAVPTPAAAGGLSIRVSLYGCWGVTNGAAVAAVTYKWSNSAGLVKQLGSGITNATGTFFLTCGTLRVEPGDDLQISVGGTAKTMSVPNLTATLDRGTDTISGRAPTSGALSLTFGVASTDATDTSSTGSPVSPTRDAEGDYTHDFTGHVNDLDARGGDEVAATWTSTSGDQVSRLFTFPYVLVRRLDQQVTGAARPFGDVSLTIRKSNNKVRGRGSDVAAALGEYAADLRTTNGDPAYPRPGDRVQGDWTGNAVNVTFPQMSTTTDTVPSPDQTQGSCPVGWRFYLRVRDPGGASSSAVGGTTGQDGLTTVVNRNVLLGSTITLTCMRTSGDRFQRVDIRES